MNEKETKNWRWYSLLFFGLWATNVAISFGAKLPSQYVRDEVLRQAFVPAVLSLFLYFVRSSDSRDKK
jgi:uncharacterized membrane protein YfcA